MPGCAIANPKQFGERVQALREAHYLGVTELAHRAGLSRHTLERIEAGGTGCPHQKTVRAIARSLGVTEGQLLHGAAVAVLDAPISRKEAVEIVAAAIEAILRRDSPQPIQTLRRWRSRELKRIA